MSKMAVLRIRKLIMMMTIICNGDGNHSNMIMATLNHGRIMMLLLLLETATYENRDNNDISNNVE